MTPPLTLVPETGDGEPTLTLAAACDALGVSASTLRRWVESGRINALRTPGGHRRFPASEIRRLSNRPGSAPVLPVTPPPTALPRIADLLGRAGGRMAVQAAQTLYQDAGDGWFSTAAASGPLHAWGATMARAARTADYRAATTSTLEIMRRARLAGTSLLERQMWLERACDLIARTAMVHQVDQGEVRAMRRLGLALRHASLQAEEKPATPGSSSSAAA
jgi:excisionase family DNA binding protein